MTSRRTFTPEGSMISSLVTWKTGAVWTTLEERTWTAFVAALLLERFFGADVFEVDFLAARTEGFAALLEEGFLLAFFMRTLYTNRLRVVLPCCS